MSDNSDYFKDAASSWDEKPRRVELAHGIAKAIANEVPLNNSISAMEFGCGTGLVSMMLADRLKSILAVDISAEMLKELEKKIDQNSITNIKPVLIDLTKNKLTERFDLIFTAMALHHVEHFDVILREFYTSLEPGGILAIADFDKGDNTFHHDKNETAHDGFERNELRDTLKETGFSEPKTVTAHTIFKEDINGNMREYTVFLMVAKKAK